jgi:hypothetical protein
MVNKLAITMIVVPYWWDGSRERYFCCCFYFILLLLNYFFVHSLIATIDFSRPDLMLQINCSPISLNNPPTNSSTHLIILSNIIFNPYIVYYVQGVGDVMLASIPASPAALQDSITPLNPW